jgi:hypothetical protein
LYSSVLSCFILERVRRNAPAFGELRMKIPAILWFIMGVGLLLLPRLTPPQIEIEWVTGSEYNTVGFNIYRAEQAEGPLIQINERLIVAEGDAVSGSQYRFVDQNVVAGQSYYYVLEDIEFSGSAQRHEAIIGQAANTRQWSLPLAVMSLLAGAGLLALEWRAAPRAAIPGQDDEKMDTSEYERNGKQ